MIDDIAVSPINGIWLGFIDAEDGFFYYVDAREIANERSLSRRERRECITAAALASVAMPGFFQQVRINQHTYYDGGVRQSVFIEHAARHGQRSIRAAHARSAALIAPATAAPAAALTAEQVDENLSVYVLRNGPTDLLAEPDADNVTKVWDAAMRAEQIVVNQLEVGSVAALRIEHPTGPLLFQSADGWKTAEYEGLNCETRKGDGIMFDPDFMRCIMAHGVDVADSAAPWRPLPDIDELRRRQAQVGN